MTTRTSGNTTNGRPAAAATALNSGRGPSTVTSGPLRRTLLTLALPVLGEQILNTFVGLFDTFLAGQLSPVATIAVGLASYVGWLASLIVMLIATGTTALVARNEGAGDHVEANRYANQSMTLAAALGVLLFAFLYTLAPWLAWYCNMTGEAFQITVRYLRIDAFGHMFMSLTLVGSAALRGAGNTRTPMVIFAVINAVNVVASCTYVYGLGLGVDGIVGGTITARIIGAFLLLTVLIQGRAGIALQRTALRFAWARTRRILRIGLPAAADGLAMWSGHFALLAIISRLADPPWAQA